MLSTPKLILLLAALVLVCGGAYLHFLRLDPGEDRPPEEVGAAGKQERAIKRVVLVTIDTLRADALPDYGYGRIQTPNLSKIVGHSTLFERAYAPAPWTRPTAVSLMSGLPPSIHGADLKDIEVEAVLPESLPTLPEYMQRAGYRTVAIGYNPFLSRSPNLKRGFERFDMFPRFGPPEPGQEDREDPLVSLENSTEALTDIAVDWIDEHANEDFFLWLHYYDPHNPYVPQKEFFSNLSSAPLPDDEEAYKKRLYQVNKNFEVYLKLGRKLTAGTGTKKEAAQYRKLQPWMNKWLPFIRDLYLAEIQQVDRAIGRVVQKLKERGLYDGTLLIVTSDHGEEWGDHGALEHGHSLYQELIHVPFIVKKPNATAATRLREPVSIISTMPTILEFCGIASLNPNVYGAPLAEAVIREKEPAEAAYLIVDSVMYGEPRVSVVSGDTKYIRRNGTLIEELYDLANDPREKKNLANDAVGQEALAKARENLEDYLGWSERFKAKLWKGEVELTRPDAEAKKLLRSHGYLK